MEGDTPSFLNLIENGLSGPIREMMRPAETAHDQGEQAPVHMVAQDEIEHHQKREERDYQKGIVERHQHAPYDQRALFEPVAS